MVIAVCEKKLHYCNLFIHVIRVKIWLILFPKMGRHNNFKNVTLKVLFKMLEPLLKHIIIGTDP